MRLCLLALTFLCARTEHGVVHQPPTLAPEALFATLTFIGIRTQPWQDVHLLLRQVPAELGSFYMLVLCCYKFGYEGAALNITVNQPSKLVVCSEAGATCGYDATLPARGYQMLPFDDGGLLYGNASDDRGLWRELTCYSRRHNLGVVSLPRVTGDRCVQIVLVQDEPPDPPPPPPPPAPPTPPTPPSCPPASPAVPPGASLANTVNFFAQIRGTLGTFDGEAYKARILDHLALNHSSSLVNFIKLTADEAGAPPMLPPPSIPPRPPPIQPPAFPGAARPSPPPALPAPPAPPPAPPAMPPQPPRTPPALPPGTPLVSNGGFEFPPLPEANANNGGGCFPSAPFGGWEPLNGTAAQFCIYGPPRGVFWQNNGYVNASTGGGNQSYHLGAGCGSSIFAGVQQSVRGLVPGLPYTLRFVASGAFFSAAADVVGARVESAGGGVLADGSFVTSGGIEDGVWDAFNLSFVADDYGAIISFRTPVADAACINLDEVAIDVPQSPPLPPLIPPAAPPSPPAAPPPSPPSFPEPPAYPPLAPPPPDPPLNLGALIHTTDAAAAEAVASALLPLLRLELASSTLGVSVVRVDAPLIGTRILIAPSPPPPSPPPLPPPPASPPPPPSPPPPGLPYHLDANQDLAIAILAAQDSAAGTPLHLFLPGSDAYVTSPIVIDGSARASEIIISGANTSRSDGRAVLRVERGATGINGRRLDVGSRPLLTLLPGAPPVRLISLQIVGAIRVSLGGVGPPPQLEVVECNMTGEVDMGGRVLQVQGGSVAVFDSAIVDSAHGGVLLEGGSLLMDRCLLAGNRAARGAGMAVISGAATIMRTSFLDNAAAVSGGGLQVDGGVVSLRNHTLFSRNSAPREAGASLEVQAGSIEYVLPAPLAHWVFIQGGCDGASTDGGVSALAPGAIDITYPFECPAGVVGEGFDVLAQSGPACSRVCPSGFFCPSATATPIPCTQDSCARTRPTPIPPSPPEPFLLLDYSSITI